MNYNERKFMTLMDAIEIIKNHDDGSRDCESTMKYLKKIRKHYYDIINDNSE